MRGARMLGAVFRAAIGNVNGQPVAGVTGPAVFREAVEVAARAGIQVTATAFWDTATAF